MEEREVIDDSNVSNLEDMLREDKLSKQISKLKLMSSGEYLESGIGKSKGFLIERLIPSSSIGMLVAPAKTNKTTFAYDIALSVATGKPCIGHNATEVGKVLFINIEGSMDGIMNAFGINDNIDIIPNKYFRWEDYKEDLIQFIKFKKYKLIIIDPLYKATKANIAKAEEVRKFLIELEDIAEKFNTTFLLCHHMQRANSLMAETTTNDISGSMNLQRACEFTIILDKEIKTDEELAIEESLSVEEFEALPQKRILRKLDYRYGGEGFPKYRLNIDFNAGSITGERYTSAGVRVNVKDRFEDLYNIALEVIDETKLNTLNSKTLADKIANKYQGISLERIKHTYMKNILIKLRDNGKLEKGKGYDYKIIR